MENTETDFSYLSNYIKGFRNSRGLSLEELSKQSGVSKSMICQIEANKTSPTLPVLDKIARAIGVSLGDLVAPEGKVHVYRRSCIHTCKSSTGKAKPFQSFLLSKGSSNRHLDVFHFKFEKKGTHKGQKHEPRTLAYLLCHEGEISIYLDDQKFELKEGEMLEFQANMQHELVQETSKLSSGNILLYYPV